MIAFQILGGASLTGEGGPLSGKSVQPRRIALLALLACHPHHTLSREKLLAFLWPESENEQGRHRLSESLYVLRKALGEDTLISEGDQVRLDPDRLYCDVVTFRAAIQEEDLVTAVNLFKGPLMDGFFLREAGEFYRWLETERNALAEEYAGALETLARRVAGEGDPLEALPWWNRLVAHDPYNSRYALGFMQTLVQSGDPGNAVQHALDHRRILREELGAEATPEVLEFAEGLRTNVDLGGATVGKRPNHYQRDPVGHRPHRPEEGGEPLPRQSGPSSATPRVPKGRAWATAVIAFIALLGVGAVAYALIGSGNRTRVPNLVVVLPVENQTGDSELDEVGFLAGFWIEEALQQIDGLQLYPSSLLSPLPPLEGEGHQDRTNESGYRLGLGSVDQTDATWAVHGIIRSPGDSLEFRIEVIDVTHPRREQRVVEVGVRDSLAVILDRMARRVTGALAYEFDPYMGEAGGDNQPLPLPPTIDAFREHRLGYQAYDRGDVGASYRHHLAAYALDTTLVRALVAAAYMARNSQERDSLARFAAERRHLLSRRGQLDLDVLTAELAGDQEAAFEAIRALARLEGGGFSSLLEASFAMRRNFPNAALEATERYDPFPDWRRGEAYRFWLYRARALHMLGRHGDELAEARAGRERYPAHRGLLTAEIRALAALGREDEVSNLLLEARSLPGIRESEGVAAGMELRAHGYPEAAQRVFNETAEWLQRSLVEEQRNGRKRLDLARALYGAERWVEAQEIATALLSEEPGDPTLLGLLGCTAARMGNAVRAEAFMDRLTREVGPRRIDERHYQMATIAAVLGRHDEAVGLLQRAYSEGYPHGIELHRDMNFEPLREREDFIALLTPWG